MILIEQIFQFLAPHDCIVCGKEGRLLCQGCAEQRLIGIHPSCYRCQRLSPFGKTCDGCRKYSNLRYVWVRTDYTPIARKVIHGLKYDHARDIAKLIAEEMALVLPRFPDSLLVHIPAVSSRVRLRGFDQSALIARELSRLTRRHHLHLLGRSGQLRQVGSTSYVRRDQMKDVFRALTYGVIKDARIILVDDVLTTGSTLEAAATVLKQAGAKSVDAVIFAQSRPGSIVIS